MTEANVSFAGNLTEDPEVRSTEGEIARAMFRVAVSARKDQEASFFTVVVCRSRLHPRVLGAPPLPSAAAGPPRLDRLRTLSHSR